MPPLVELWKYLPSLSDIPEAELSGMDPNHIFLFHSALSRDRKLMAKLSVTARLAQNAKKVASTPITVAGGLDNRRDILHPARYLGGANCSNQEQWLRSRQVIGEAGHTAVGNYDLDSVGCGGSVTPKGWELLHNPASTDLKIKMFYMPNVTCSGMAAKRVSMEDGDDALAIGENLKEIVDFDGYRSALNTLREATHSVRPWDRSIGALVGFMTNTNYLQEDLRANQRRAAILSEFTDHVLARNALNYVNDHGFLTTEDLAHTWAQWKSKRTALFQFKREEKPWSKGKKSDICRRFNVGVCPKQNEKECKSYFGATLRHVCNKFTGPGRFCEKDHSRKDHK